MLALEQGEVDGRCGWSRSSLTSRNRSLYEDKKSDLRVRPISGEVMQNLVAEIYRSPSEVAKIAADAIKGGN